MKSQIIFGVVAIAAIGLLVSANNVYASITPGSPPNCTNGSGSLPPGQQTQCQNSGGLTQNPGTCASNPDTKCPPGQNK